MFFILSKLVWFVLAPSNLLILMAFAGLALIAFRPRAGRRLLLLSLLMLVFAGIGPLGNILLLPLEQRFPAIAMEEPPPDGIIVLGGAVDDRVTPARGGMLHLTESGDRVLALIALARRFPETKIVFTGGAADVISVTEEPEAVLIRNRISDYGVHPSRLLFEARSRNTYENAVFTRELINPRPDETYWIVTSAFHMPRSIGIFRKAGFRVRAYPVDYRTASSSDAFAFSVSVAEGLRRTDIAAREWLGLLAYWSTGKTDALFPGPD